MVVGRGGLRFTHYVRRPVSERVVSWLELRYLNELIYQNIFQLPN